MEDINFFRTQRYFLNEIESADYIYTDDLLSLIKDNELKQLIINKYNLTKNIKIEIEKIDNLYDLVAQYSQRFALMRIEAKESDVTCELVFDENNQNAAYIFNIKNGNEGELFYDTIQAEAIYDSINLFYKDKSLSQYVKSLQKVPGKRLLMADLNDSWSHYYKHNEKAAKTKLFRILKRKEKFYLKSINSSLFREYGIAESFVLATLELNKFKISNPNVHFKISSISISESKLDLIISQIKSVPIGDLGFLRSSISVRNEDQGNTSFGVYSTLEFFPKTNDSKKIYLFPKHDNNKIKNFISSKHTVSSEGLLETFSKISELFNLSEEMKNDFQFYKGSTSFDELRSKIEFKLITNNSPFKNIKKLKDLFSRDKTGHIDNLETLLKICADSDFIEMDHDLKFQLRYLISNVLLYNSNQY